MSATHVLPPLPESAPVDTFVQSNKIPSIEKEEYETEEMYVTTSEAGHETITISPGDVVHRTGENDSKGCEVSTWASGETWWLITAVASDQFILYDLQTGIFRVWNEHKVYNDIVYNNYEYNTFTDTI